MPKKITLRKTSNGASLTGEIISVREADRWEQERHGSEIMFVELRMGPRPPAPKKSSSNKPEPYVPDPPTVRVPVTKDMASRMVIGKRAKVSIELVG
jgi:hypothetical protein